MRFGAFLVFAAVWSVLVYEVLAHWAFGDGWLRPRTRVDETLDVLAAHGIAGFTGILFIGFFAQASSASPTASSTATRRSSATRRSLRSRDLSTRSWRRS